jgi:hypothetical protein
MSVIQLYESGDPDPYQNAIDTEHFLKQVAKYSTIKFKLTARRQMILDVESHLIVFEELLIFDKVPEKDPEHDHRPPENQGTYFQ